MSALYDGRALLLSGFLMTCKIFGVSAVICLAMSLIAGIARVSAYRAVRYVAIAYVELFRGTSVVVQLFWLYFALPFFGVKLSAFEAACIGLGLCFGAYGAEIVRGALIAVPRGQIEAAIALNMSPLWRLRRIIFPQAVLIMLPSVANLLILMLKATSTASLITLPELTFQAYSLNVRTFATVPIFVAVLFLYFVPAFAVSRLLGWAERRYGRWRLREPATAGGLPR